MPNDPNLGDLINRFFEEERQKKAIAEASDEKLLEIWDNWDGMALMTIDGKYIPESGVHYEIQRRKLPRDL